MSESIVAQFGSVGSPLEAAISKHLTEDTIKDLIEFQKLREGNRHTESMSRHRHRPRLLLVSILALLAFILLLSWMSLFYGKSEVILPVVTGVGGVITGGLGGYGFGRESTKKHNA